MGKNWKTKKRGKTNLKIEMELTVTIVCYSVLMVINNSDKMITTSNDITTTRTVLWLYYQGGF